VPRGLVGSVDLSEEATMPVIRVEMWEGRTVQQKEELVRALTRETVRVAGCPAESVYVIIADVAKTNWGSGGELVAIRDGEATTD
jgi:4-oxalocrotonate tautomerase